MDKTGPEIRQLLNNTTKIVTTLDEEKGEKLYVTADKRGEKVGCKRPLCWTLLGLVVAAIVALIVLAATGILFTNSPTPLEQYNASISSARAFGGISSDNNRDHDNDLHGHHHDHSDHNHEHEHNDHDHHQSSSSPPQFVTETQSDEGQNPSIMSDESSDMSMYVPRTVEGELKIDNEIYVPAFEDTESEEYREFTSTFSDALKHALFDRNSIENGDNEIMVEVVKIRKGSVIVTYRIHWIPKHNAEPTEDLLTAQSLKTNLNNYLNNNNRMISIYHVANEDLATKPVLDLCKINNNDCEYKCEFDDSILDFICVCPHGQMSDTSSPKKCMPILDNSEPRHLPETTSRRFENFDSNGNTKSIPVEEKPSMGSEENEFDWKQGQHHTPETTTETESDLNFSHIFGHEDTETPKPEPNPEQEINSTPEPQSSQESEEESKPEPTIEPKLESKSDAMVEPEPEPTAEPKPEPTIESKEESEQEPQVEPEPEPAAEPKPEPTAEPNFEPEPTAKHESESSAEPQAEPEPSAEPEPEPTAEPKDEPELEPNAERKAEPEPEPNAEPKAEPEPEPTAEPKAEPEPEPTAEPKAEPETEPTAEPKAEPEPEPTAEPKAEPGPTTEIKNDEKTKIEMASEIMQTVPRTEPNIPESETQSNIESKQTDEPDSNVATIVGENEQKLNEATELKTTPKPMFDPTTFDLDSVIGLHTTLEPFTTQKTEIFNEKQTSFEDKKIESMKENSDKKESSMDDSIVTTMRVSISEPNVINDPSYEPNPEIISILQQNGHSMSSNDNFTNEDSTNDNDWLESDENVTTLVPQTTMITSNGDFMKTQNEKEISDDRVNKSESRSSKTLNDLIAETMTEKINENIDDGITFDMIKKNNEMPLESTTVKINMEESVTSKEGIQEKNTEDESVKNAVESTTSAHVFTNKIHDQNEDNTSNLNQNHMGSIIVTSTETSNVNTINTSQSQMPQSIYLNENHPTETTTAIIDTMGSFSIHQQNKDTHDDKNLMETLEKTTMSSPISNDKELDNENKDVTFDTINMLYNRSSKAVLDKENNMEDITESNEVLKDSSETSTDSDWLSESVTEVSLEDITKSNDSNESTETPTSKVDEIMGHGFAKDDFEPDYLNNMGSNTSKISDRDENLYGMSQDYENDDSRVKRVNIQKDKSLEISTLNSNSFETTTIGQYIYKMAEKTINGTAMTPETSMTTSRPAPVWEETENGSINDEMSNSEMNEHNPIENINVMTSTITPPTTALLIKQVMEQNNLPNMTDMSTQNTTQVNNLNVTIYEISNQNDNQSFITTKATNAQSTEFVDHETDMNPFLPEVENNKSLVKKLQEGHDIDPTNLNETQNENGDDHNINSSDVPSTNESNLSSSDMSQAKKTAEENDVSVISAQTTTTTANVDDIFNKLFTNSYSDIAESFPTTTEINKPSTNSFTSYNEEQTSGNSGSKEVLPISTFLLDTDDLDTTKRPAVSPANDLNNEADTTSSKPIQDIDNEFLSVVPIEQENDNELRKNYNSKNIQEFNSISDSPKKSDRRTDVNNFDSLLNNEA
ncbi:unnamed protein product [Euphydryas editha]|uniref:SEA domain-containing protein n=1 Tax=Euphydryas editha TaxID=104508 RepID=A0AAU9UK74_EUPED|nr:unnamed protein product [Euphydryas editha]